jgi:hypothetical protein
MEPDDETLGDRARARGWEPANGRAWTVASPDGSLRAVVRAHPEGYSAEVTRHQAQPIDGVPAQPAHGPELFESCEDAMDYAESNLGTGWHSAAE